MKETVDQSKYMSALTPREKILLTCFAPFLIMFIIIFQFIVMPVISIIEFIVWLVKGFFRLMSKEVLILEIRK
jgi:hypothetical protein